MKAYVDLLNKIIAEGEVRTDRTGVGTLAIFGGQVSFDLRERFPVVTIKKTLIKSALTEMLWFIRGEDNTDYLKAHNVPIWDDWADANGKLGPVYGVQWRKWPGATYYTHPRDPGIKLYPEDLKGKSMSFLEDLSSHSDPIDQLKQLIEKLKTNPKDRRLIVTAWNVADLPRMALPPCHRDFQCFVSNDGDLDLMMSIRSWDTALGGPFNIAQYAFLTHLLARTAGLKPRWLKINYGDAHLYLNHLDAIKERLATVEPIDCPTRLVINTDNTDIDGYKPDDFEVAGYESHPFLKLPIAV